MKIPKVDVTATEFEQLALSAEQTRRKLAIILEFLAEQRPKPFLKPFRQRAAKAIQKALDAPVKCARYDLLRRLEDVRPVDARSYLTRTGRDAVYEPHVKEALKTLLDCRHAASTTLTYFDEKRRDADDYLLHDEIVNVLKAVYAAPIGTSNYVLFSRSVGLIT